MSIRRWRGKFAAQSSFSDPEDFEGRAHVLEILITRDQGGFARLGEGGGDGLLEGGVVGEDVDIRRPRRRPGPLTTLS